MMSIASGILTPDALTRTAATSECRHKSTDSVGSFGGLIHPAVKTKKPEGRLRRDPQAWHQSGLT